MGEDQALEQFAHVPVMVHEVAKLLADLPAGVVVDATLGGAGHAVAILESRDDLLLLGVDRDARAIAAAEARLAKYADRVRIAHSRFSYLREVLRDEDRGPIVGVLFDLGVSSHHFDDPARGFSYRADGPLDMRMDQRDSITAEQIVNNASVEELAALFSEHGESRYDVRIATAIVAARPISSTTVLADVVANSLPAPARRKGHPAKRVFQALRVAVNDELGELAEGLNVALETVVSGGRIVTLAYHSGEDRLIKQTFLAAERNGCTCPETLPCVCGRRDTSRIRILTRGSRKATAAELAANPRAEAARLRAVEIKAEA
jgi:16S rRNA (cytosine1402-N4)-methyltransferase